MQTFSQLGRTTQGRAHERWEALGETGRERITVQIKENYVAYRFSNNTTLILGKAPWEIPDLWRPFWKAMLKRKRETQLHCKQFLDFQAGNGSSIDFSHPGTNTFHYVDSIVRVLPNPQSISVGNVTGVVTGRLQRVKRMLQWAGGRRLCFLTQWRTHSI